MVNTSWREIKSSGSHTVINSICQSIRIITHVKRQCNLTSNGEKNETTDVELQVILILELLKIFF